jgi:hypothetical protein
MSRLQKGGSDFDDVQLWGQDQTPPSSYKIQIGYLEIPKTIKFDEKWLDTPYRFKSFHDANDEASRIFDGYLIRVVGSNDNPYWDAPSYLHQNRQQLKPADSGQKWYDVVGVKSHDENPFSQYSPSDKPPTLSPEREYSLSQLSRLQSPVRAKEEALQQPNQNTRQSRQTKQESRQIKQQSRQTKQESRQKPN